MERTPLNNYAEGKTSFVTGIHPAALLQLPIQEVLAVLKQRLGTASVEQALQPESTVECAWLQNETDGTWLKQTHMVGINIRTIGDWWAVIPYALSLPKAQNSIHLLPIWEPGVVASLYGMASWHLNDEFFSTNLQNHYPHLNTSQKQLKVVINLLHLMGKAVGMDVIPHTDRYSEIVLAQPSYFEWLRREGMQITEHHADLWQAAASIIWEYVVDQGSAGMTQTTLPENSSIFFTELSEAERTEHLFGPPQFREFRTNRRNELITLLYHAGLEPVPATMAPPYRGLEVDPDPAAVTVDADGRRWHDYRITKPQKMSRVFGPLARYQLYGRKNENKDWEIDFEQPRTDVWAYVNRHYRTLALELGMDFMRGDMSHVQMRPEGVPTVADAHYDLHQYVKKSIQADRPWFGYFAESFLAPPNEMGYGDENEHLDRSDADTTLGDLQSMVVGSPTFNENWARYLQIAQNHTFKPSFTLMTADKDDPRFDAFYLSGNALRYFIGHCCGALPSYMGLGFEVRDPHPFPAPNEHYTKLYVFQINEGPKATHGPYCWGQNEVLFAQISAVRIALDALEGVEDLAKAPDWLIAPSRENTVVAWRQGERFLAVANLDLAKAAVQMSLPWQSLETPRFLFGTHQNEASSWTITSAGLVIEKLLPGEGRLYRL